MAIVSVRLLDAPYRADRTYDYAVSEGEFFEGCLVAVPFGQGNRPQYAVVTAVKADTEHGGRTLKHILSVVTERLSLSPEALKICFFLHKHTLCSVGEAVRAVMPVAALGLLREEYHVAQEGASDKYGVCAFLTENPGATASDIAEKCGKAAVKALSALCKEGKIRRESIVKQEMKLRTARFYEVADDEQTSAALLADPKAFRTEGQRNAYAFLRHEGQCREDEILDRLNISRSPLATLVKNGRLLCTEKEVDRNPYAALTEIRHTEPVCLSQEQQTAYESLASLYDTHEASCALLYGVTGSGKTNVVMKLLDKVLGEGKTAIMLVPEIALTPQTVGIFCARYGQAVSVLHSSLSVGERYDAYRRIRTGQTRLVIGTRSAVFAPTENLGLIIIDEEHEHTYKSDAAPRYHTKDIAAFRSGVHGALTVLASATPSIESFYKAQTGKYTLVPLRTRYGGAVLPTVQIVDMREEMRMGNMTPISRLLGKEMQRVKEEGRQTVLFLNRRGYHHTVSCKNCGEALMCPHCSVSLTYHTSYSGAYLLCHSCGYKAPVPSACPQCASEHLSFLGFGTQKAEAALAECELTVLRMDADTTSSRAAYERLLGRFRAKQADVLLGTQMVTKGHDFPSVSLSGVLLADTSLYMNDFRAAERTFSLLTQVIGRAGRTKTPGRAVIQTFCPENEVILLAAKQDYDAFYKGEIALRRSLCNPPFCDIAEILLTGEDEQLLLSGAANAKERLVTLLKERASDLFATVYGPLELQNYKVAERYRMKILVKCRLSARLRSLFADFLTAFTAAYPRLSAVVDFNPTDT